MTEPMPGAAQQPVMVIGPLPPPYGGWAHEVSSICKPPFADKLDVVTFNTRLYDTIKPGDRGLALRRAFSQVFDFQGVVRRQRPRIVILFTGVGLSFWRDLLLFRSARAASVPVIVRFLGGRMTEWLAQIPPFIRPRVLAELSKARAVLVETNQMVEQWQRLCPTVPVYRVPNFIHMSEMPPPLEKPESPVRVGYLGSMTPEKGVEHILACVDAVCDQHPAEFHFIGGELRSGYLDAFRARAAGLRHPHAVHIYGYLPHDEALRRLNACHIFVFPTAWTGEGQPAALVEAMAMGLVPVAAGWRGVGEIIRSDDNGLLMKSADSTEIAAQIIRLTQHKDLRDRLSKNARQTIMNQYEAHAALAQYEQILTQVLSYA